MPRGRQLVAQNFLKICRVDDFKQIQRDIQRSIARLTSTAVGSFHRNDCRSRQLHSTMTTVDNDIAPKKSSVTIESDNPCWGSPTQCGLPDLLRLFPKDRAILFDSPHYLVLNKPPDLRMDGPYASTVHKLLAFWYPSPFLIAQCSKDDGDTDEHSDAFQQRLLDAVGRIHQCNALPDNFLRHCHQLDYATSGILLVAKTQAAAAHVTRLLEDRKVTKSYLAIVVGHILGEKYTHTHTEQQQQNKFPVWRGENTNETNSFDEATLRRHLQRLEKRYRKMRSKVNKQHNKQLAKDTNKHNNKIKTTFPGYQPVHSLFQKWKARMERQSRNEDAAASHPTKKRRKQKPVMLSDLDWERIWAPVDALLATGDDLYSGESWYQGLEWKELGEEYSSLKHAMTEATDVHNDILRNAMAKNEQSFDNHTNDDEVMDLPTLFRLETSKGNATVFYISCPLAEDSDSFSMVVPSHIVKEFPDMPKSTHPKDSNSHLGHEYKPSLTKCTVLEQGKCTLPDGTVLPITKVKLFPVTGRRHQLRVHMALSGHPILGDMTYCQTSIALTDRNDADSSARMYLHAHSLALPSLVGEPEGEAWEIETPDPFAIEQGILKL
jgi:23S rRNA-/tRNA-specific pseudouridylate synthase